MRDAGNGVYDCEYYPLKPGKYTVVITWGGQPIPRRSEPPTASERTQVGQSRGRSGIGHVRSPFEVEVGPEAGFQKVRAWGPGLKTGMVGKSADFVVEAIGADVGTLGKSKQSH